MILRKGNPLVVIKMSMISKDNNTEKMNKQKEKISETLKKQIMVEISSISKVAHRAVSLM